MSKHHAASLIDLLQSMNNRQIEKMTNAEAKRFRKEVMERFRQGAIELFEPILAGIPGVAPGTYSSFIHTSALQVVHNPSIGQANVILSSRVEEFSAQKDTDFGVFELFEAEPAELALGLRACEDARPEPSLYLAVTCSSDPAQGWFESAVMAAGSELQAACAGVSSFLVFSQCEADVLTQTPGNLGQAVKECMRQVRVTAEKERCGYLEPFGIELVVTGTTTPEALSRATLAIARLYHAVSSRTPIPTNFIHQPVSRVVH